MIPGPGRSPGEGNGNPLQCSCLENPRDRETWWAAIYGVAQSWTRLKQLSSSSSRLCIWNTFSQLQPSSSTKNEQPRDTELYQGIQLQHKSWWFCTTKETISKVKRQPLEWKKIIANEATDKQLISKIYKQLLQLNSRKNKGQRTK